MNIAELFVRIRGDTTDVTRKLKGVETSMAGVSRSADGSHLSLNKMQNALSQLVIQSTGTNRAVGTLISTLGSFAAGSGVMLGVTAGIAGVVKLYDLLTSSSRKAREESDKLTQSLVEQARSQRAATVAGAEDIKLIKETQLQALQRESGSGVRSLLERSFLPGGTRIGLHPTDAAAQANKIADAQLAVTQATKNWTDAWEAANKSIKTAVGHTLKLKDMAQEVAFSWKDAFEYVRRFENTIEKITLREALAGALPNFVAPDFSMPHISMPFEGLDERQKDQLRQLGVLTDHADDNANKLRDAIWGSATALANTVVGALNIGGGGKGSNLGGALGSTAGFALGFAFGGGPIGGAIGSTIGSIAGSLFGGLFDNSKATRENTSVTRELIQALLLNAPAGFRVESYRYGSTSVGGPDIDEIATAQRRRQARGGTGGRL